MLNINSKFSILTAIILLISSCIWGGGGNEPYTPPLSPTASRHHQPMFCLMSL